MSPAGNGRIRTVSQVAGAGRADHVSDPFTASAGWWGPRTCWRWQAFGLAVLLLALASGVDARAQGEFRAQVVAVHDGDDVTVLRGREQVRVRLWGIDAPELGQPFGSRARQELAGLVFRRTVMVRVLATDDYGRTVARLSMDGIDVNRELVRRGMAWWYRRFARRARDLSAAETEARNARRGLWSDPRPEPPWEFRRRQAARS